MSKRSAGILLFRKKIGDVEVFLVHPGGPFWAKKDDGAWSIPKGEYGEGEDTLVAAKREFEEETGVSVDGHFFELGEVKQPGGKIVKVWALEHDLDSALIKSNTFELEWPPRSGVRQLFPEVDRGGWFRLPQAETKLLKGQLDFLNRLVTILRT